MNKEILSKAIDALSKGELIVYPTDTIYGIGADIFNESAVKKVFEVKKRPENNPLPIAVAKIEDIERLAIVNENARILANHFLPGKLTLVLRKRPCVPYFVTGGSDNVAVRIPNNEIALQITSKFGPITATSANIHGKETPSNIKDIKKQFKRGDISVYIDYGVLEGKASTVVDVSSGDLIMLREGDIKKKQLLEVIKHG